MVRFHLVRIGPGLRALRLARQLRPRGPALPDQRARRNTPASWPSELGLFHTTGMVEDHTGLNNERIGEEAFLDQCDDAWREREAMMRHELERFDEGLFYCLFDTPDRVQHMFWRFREPDHPANHGEPLRPSSPGRSRSSTAAATRSSARPCEFADDQTLVIALSDHGFGSFRAAFHLNTWLHDHGLLALKAGLEPGEAAGDLLRGVDWARTRAYALGLGGHLPQPRRARGAGDRQARRGRGAEGGRSPEG